MTEAARSEVDADPDRPRLVGEDVDVVIARADGAELLPRLLDERLVLVLAGDIAQRVPRGRVEERVVHRRVARFIPAADAERDRPLDVVREALELGAFEAVDREVGPNRGVATGDVEPDAYDGGLVVVRG